MDVARLPVEVGEPFGEMNSMFTRSACDFEDEARSMEAIR